MPQTCEPCLEFDLECSILDHPEQYPCTVCCEEDVPCIITRPTTAKAKAGSAAAKLKAIKKQKEREKRKKEHEKLEAKRLKQVANRRIRPEDRKYIACAPCRQGNMNCTLKSKANIGPCRKCLSTKTTCSFEDKVVKTPKAEKGGKKNSTRKNSNTSKTNNFNKSRKSSFFSAHQKVKIPPGMLKQRITTSFCHPVTFNAEPSPQSPSCYLHQTVAFALIGLGEVSVDVLAPKNPSAETPFVYTEIATANDRLQGHSADGEEPTSVCVPCTFDRLRILECSAHAIRGLSDVGDPLAFNYEDAISKVLSDHATGLGANEAGHIKWCSVCVAPAFYECCAPAKFGFDALGAADGNDLGCGLLLCEICAKGMCGEQVEGLLEDVGREEMVRRASEAGSARTGYSGSGYDAKGKGVAIPLRRSVGACVDLDTLIAGARSNILAYEDGVRADAGWLTKKGELSQWWMSGVEEYGEESAEEDDTKAARFGGFDGEADAEAGEEKEPAAADSDNWEF